MRKRKRDWPIMVYKFRAYVNPSDLPQAVWDHARSQNYAWNDMITLSEKTLEQWKAVKEAGDKDATKAFWDAFYGELPVIAASYDLGWESEAEIVDRFTTSIRTAFKQPDRGMPRKRFALSPIRIEHRYTGGGWEAEKMFGSRAQRFAIYEPPPEGAYADESREARRQRVVDARFGVGGETFDLRLRLHRPVPEGAFIKRVAWLGNRIRRPVGWSWVWHVALWLEIPPNGEARQVQRVAGLDFGWRKFDDYIRVGYLYDGENKLELRLDLNTSNYRTRRDSLPYTIFDKQELDAKIATDLDSTKAEVKLLLADIELPQDIRGSVAQIQKMRDRGLSRLNAALKEAELDAVGVARACALLDAFEERSHNHRYWSGRLMDRLTRRREWTYGNLAAWLAKGYDAIGWEGDLDIKRMAEDSSNDPALKHSQTYRQIAAIGDLRQRIKNACDKHGTQLIDVDAAGTTHWCSVAGCGKLIETGADLILECADGHRMDQDLNAARNIFSQICGDFEQPAGLRNGRVVDGKEAGGEAKLYAVGDFEHVELQIPEQLAGVAVLVHPG